MGRARLGAPAAAPRSPRTGSAIGVTGCALAAVALVAGGCGSSGHTASAAPASPVALLQRSRTVVNATPAVHFTLSSQNVTGSSTELTGGSGDLVRPDELSGSFSVPRRPTLQQLSA